ncbi:hypothetical protein CVT25_000403 [Psilocybe cyanescens]|uniref:O-methylsterigmatocystin oxidoreductase n=1 Tax=Psilocybe cyanescens TaxID=93625 RepID=A0A409XUG9_PSICY|nr:hypothetical protein CVT25_000403 [Psilocybe cyanescens]
MAFSITVAYIVLAIWTIKKLANLLVSNAKRAPYPPGPKPLPLIGNMLDIPPNRYAQAYADWGKKYNSQYQFEVGVYNYLAKIAPGPVLHAEVLGNHLLIINKREDAIELLEQRAKIYSDRPTMPILKL